MDEITASSLEDDGAVALARPTSRRSFLAVGAANYQDRKSVV